MQRAVITSDIDGSTRLGEELLEEVVARIETEGSRLTEEGRILASEFFRGDSFQMIVTEPADALEVAMTIKTSVNAIGSRQTRASRGAAVKANITQSIAIGQTDARDHLAHARDEVFIRSGRGLDHLKEEGVSIGVFSAQRSLEDEMMTSLFLWNHIMNGWTRGAAQVFYRKLRKVTEVEIAAIFGVSQPAINQSAKKAGWHAYQRLEARYRQLCKALSENNFS